ncbi:GNAT family N-acetyltransferase [Streptococcus pluranimalium]|uniref:L-amino acid N-acyltransferase MnaT n=1 Tax=Streptococcus pluranimalium TaxID=82348 RepID=A0A345VMW1_9STRE|nr:GNAT family N-acetyltransferase [Streptococcus pluranimalium]AXJ14063.1 L-amino acid N-acyltransferase MnaT [Streptococcus pluranimalium]
MKIRYMTLDDVEDIVSIENKVWTAETTPAPLPISDANKVIEKYEQNTKYLVAEDEDGLVLGVLDFHTFYPFESGKHIVTFGIAVDPDERREGVGQALIDYFFKEALADNYRKVIIHVLSTNHQAVQFYEELGFTQEARLKETFLINGNYVDDLMFSYDLEAFDA